MRAEDVLAQVARLVGLGDGGVEDVGLGVVLAADEDEGVAGVGGERGDGDPLDQLVGVALHQLAVLEGARLGLIGVAAEVLGHLAARQEGGLFAHREAGAAASPQAGVFELLEDLVRLQRAQAYEDQGDLDKARADYEAALKVDKHSVAQYRLQRLGEAAGKRPRPSAGDSGGVKDTAGGTAAEKAATAGDRAARSLATCESGGPTLAPDDRIAACNAALAVLTEEAARQNFVLFLDRARAFAWRGWASYEKGEYDTALTDLDEAIRTDPNFKFMFFMRGTIHFAKKDFAKATADLSLAAKNNFQPAFAQLAAVYFEQKDYVSAMAQLDDALERDAKDAGALFTREKVHMALGKPADALRDCQAALAIATELKGKRTCLAEAKAQSPAAPKMEAPTAAQAPAALPVKPTATPATQSTAASPPAKSATSETPPAAGPKPNMKSLPKDWINAR